MGGSIASLYRHPIKGFTPEALPRVDLTVDGYFPHDRAWAVEVGPSGFDPSNPQHISKQRFTVLARFPQLARLKTYLAADGATFHVGDAHGFEVQTRLDTEDGRQALERFLQAFLGEDAPAQLRVLEAPRNHRFLDHPKGFVSLINLATVRAVEKAVGKPIDPLRFRANIYVDGLAAWAEDAWLSGHEVAVGGARLSFFKPIVRCVATDVSLESGVRDIDMVAQLRAHFGRDTLGSYFSIARGGPVAVGDAVG